MFMRAIVVVLKALLEGLGDDGPKAIRDELRDIKENHLAHIYTRLGGLEAKVGILLAIMGMVLMALLGQLADAIGISIKF